VRRIVEGVLAGRSIYSITQELANEGIPARRSDRWTLATVRQMVRGDYLLGRVTAKGALVRDDNGVPVQFWEPLVTVDELERLRAMTERTPSQSAAPSRRRASRLLSGLVPCPSCGGILSARGRGDNPAVYACTTRSLGGVCARGVLVECHRIEDEVERQFLAVVGRYDVVEPVVSVREVAGLAAVEEAIRHTTDELRDPEANLGALVERLTALRTERERLDALPTAPVVEMVETGETFAQAWHRHDTAGRRALLLSSGAAVILDPARQRGRWDPSRVHVAVSRIAPPGDADGSSHTGPSTSATRRPPRRGAK